VRVLIDGAWGLVRASNTQPLLVLRWESTSEPGLKKIQALIEGTVQKIREELGG
jgi:phosphomannomutase/phosphoglucomutase